MNLPPAYPAIYQRRTEFLKIGLAEWLIIGASVVCFGLYSALGIKMVTPWSLLAQRVISLGLFYLYAQLPFFLVIRFIHLRQQRSNQVVPPLHQTWRYFLNTQLNTRVLIQHANYLFSLAWLFVLFIQLKNLAPFIVTRTFDDLFERFERGLFGGALPSTLVREYFGSKYAEAFSDGYFLFYPFVALIIYIFLFQPNQRLRAEFLLAFSLCWIVGALLVLVLPTVGPCFASEISYLSTGIPETGVSRMQDEIWNLRLQLLNNGRGVNLVSGFPSLHTAVVCLGAIYLRKISSILSFIAAIFLGLTIIFTLYFSWHYLLDDLGGIVLAIFSARFARFKYAQYLGYTK